jgi:hypothetical protein
MQRNVKHYFVYSLSFQLVFCCLASSWLGYQLIISGLDSRDPRYNTLTGSVVLCAYISSLSLLDDQALLLSHCVQYILEGGPDSSNNDSGFCIFIITRWKFLFCCVAIVGLSSSKERKKEKKNSCGVLITLRQPRGKNLTFVRPHQEASWERERNGDRERRRGLCNPPWSVITAAPPLLPWQFSGAYLLVFSLLYFGKSRSSKVFGFFLKTIQIIR